jgi:uridine nucleosidase
MVRRDSSLYKLSLEAWVGSRRPTWAFPGILPNILFSGASGLDGTNLLPSPLHPPSPKNAILAARDALLTTQQHTAWVIATGALTNIALLFATFPEVGAWIKGLSIMGGAIGGGFTNAPMGKVDGKERVGNWTNWAEFNIYVSVIFTLYN